MSADVDAAREALQAAIVTNATARQVIEAIDAFEAAIRAEARGDCEAECRAQLDAERAAALDEARAAVEALIIATPSADGLTWNLAISAAIDALREDGG